MKSECLDLIEIQFQRERGEKPLHHGVAPTAALGGYAAADSVLAEKGAMVAGPVLAALFRVN